MTTPAKPNKLTPEQIKELDLARLSDLSNDDWVQLYLEEFPPHERRDVEQLRRYLKDGRFVMHETRDKNGLLLSWSISRHSPAKPGTNEPSFWFGCWTVTRRSAQSTGVGRVHFPAVIKALKAKSPHYLGRTTEIESTEGMAPDSQQVRRAKFYAALGLKELHLPYEFPLFQPIGATEYVPQSKLGKPVKAQLLIAPFSDAPISGKQAYDLVKSIYINSYNVHPDDPFVAERLALIDVSKDNLLGPVRIGSVDNTPKPTAPTPAPSVQETTTTTKKKRGSKCGPKRRCSKACRRKSRKLKR
jgi:hypothetical protein